MATTITSNEGYNSSVSPDPTPEFKPSSFAENDSFEQDLLRPSIEAERKYQEEGLKIRRTNYETIKKHTLDFDNFEPEQTNEVRNRVLVSGYLDSQFSEGDRPSNDHDILRDSVAKQKFKGEGVGSDEAFVAAIRKDFEGENEKQAFYDNADRQALLSAYLGGGRAKKEYQDSVKGNPLAMSERVEINERWKKTAEKIEDDFGASMLHDLRTTFKEMGTEDQWLALASRRTRGYSDEDKNKFIAALRDLATTYPSEAGTTFLGNFGKGARRGVMGALDKGAYAAEEFFRSALGSAPHNVFVAPFAENLGTEESKEWSLEKREENEKEVRDWRDGIDWLAEMRDVQEQDLAPTRPLAPRDTSLRAVEEGIYAIPGAITTSAVAFVPLVGMPLSFGMMKEFDREKYRREILANGGSREDAYNLAGGMSMVSAVPNMLLEKFQSYGLAGKVPGMGKVFGKIDDIFANKLGRFGTKMLVAGAAETTVELTQQANTDLVQDLTNSFKEFNPIVPDIEWKNGKDGHFDGYFNKTLTTFVAVAPLGVMVAGRGLTQERRAEAMKQASPLERKAFGITEEDNARIEEAKTPREMVAAFQNAMENREPFSDTAQASVMELEEMHRMRTQTNEDAETFGVSPSVRKTPDKSTFEVFDRLTGDTIAEVETAQEATEEVFEQLQMKEEESRHYFQELRASFEAAALDVEQSGEAVEVGTGTFTDADAEAAMPGSGRRLQTERELLEQRDGGTGAVAQEVMSEGQSGSIAGVYVPAGKMGRKEAVTQLHNGSSVLTLIHERGHAKRRKLMESGAWKRGDQVASLRGLDNLITQAEEKFLPENFEELNEYDQEVAIDEAIAELAEVLALNSRKGKNSKMGGFITRNLSAMVQARVPGAAQLKSFLGSMRDFFGLQLRRATILRKAVRDGDLDQAQVDQLTDMLVGTNSQEIFEQERDAIPTQMVDGQQVRESTSTPQSFEDSTGHVWQGSQVSESELGTEYKFGAVNDSLVNGTGRKVNEFGFFFSNQKQRAEVYRDQGRTEGDKKKNPGTLRKVKLTGNVLNLSNQNLAFGSDIIEHIEEELGIDTGMDASAYSTKDAWEALQDGGAKLREKLQSAGYDGVAIDEYYDRNTHTVSTAMFSDGNIQIVESNGKPVESDGQQVDTPFSPVPLSIAKSHGAPTSVSTGGSNMVAVHNLTPENLHFAEENFGVIPPPSIAILRTDLSEFEGFGEISLIVDPGFIDPANRDAKVWNADAYTPRFPQFVYAKNDKVANEIWNELKGQAEEIGGSRFDVIPQGFESDGLSALEQSEVFQYAYLQEIGKAPKVIKKKRPIVAPALSKYAKGKTNAFELAADPEFIKLAKIELEKEISDSRESIQESKRERYFTADGDVIPMTLERLARQAVTYHQAVGVDATSTRIAINKRIESHREKFKSWISEKFSALEQDKKIPNGFTPMGNRKFLPFNLDNVVKAMTRNVKAGEGFNYGVGSIRAAASKQFKSLKQIKGDREKIVSTETMEAFKKEVDEEFSQLTEELAPFYNFDSTSFGYYEQVSEGMMNLAGSRGTAWRESFTGVDSDVMQKVTDFLNKLKNAPTEYFEVKVMDGVDVGAFDVAVVPKKTDSETKNLLKSKGLKIRLYDPKIKGDRQRVIQGAADAAKLSFSPGDSRMLSNITPAQDAEYLEAVESGDVETQQRMVDDAAKAAGYDSPRVFHGSIEPNIKSFDLKSAVEVEGGIFFSDDISVADEYTYERAYGDIISDEPLGDITEAYLSLRNPLEYQTKPNQTIVDAVEMTRAIQSAKAEGHDGLIIRGIDDTVGATGDISDILVAFNPNQIKSADPVTRDDDGNVIPLSQRFDQSRDEISFSPGDARMLSDLSENVMRRVRAPEARAVVFEQLVDRIDALKRDVSKMIFGGTVEQEALPDARSMKSLKKEAAFRQADLRKQYQEDKAERPVERARTEANEWLEEQVAQQKKYYNPVARIRRSLVMYDAILKTLPPELRGKMGGFVQIAKLNSDQKRLEFLQEKVEQLDKEVDKWISGKHRKQIEKIFKANKPKKKSSGQAKTNSDFKYADQVMEIEKISKMTREQVDAEIEEIDQSLKKEEDEFEIMELTDRRDKLSVFGNIDGMKANALGDFYQNLNTIHRQGKLLKAMSDEQFNQFLQETIDMVNNDVSGGQGEMTQSEAKLKDESRKSRVIPTRFIGAEDVKIDGLSDFHRKNVSFEWLMNTISRANKSVGTLASETHKRLSTMVHIATHQEKRDNLSTQEQFREVLAGIFGVIAPGQTSINMDLTNKIHEMEKVEQTNISKMEYGRKGRSSTKRIPASKVQALLNGDATLEGLGISESDWAAIQARYTEIKESEKSIKPNTRVEYESQTEGEAKMMALSQSQAINLTMLWRQKGLKESMEHEGYSDQTMKDMEEFLTPESKEIREWLTIQYEDNYHKINKVFRAQNGFSLPKTDFYSPAIRMAQKEAKDMSIDSEGRQAMSVDPNFTILRTTNRAPMDQTAGALNIWMAHSTQTNHYVAWADTVKVLRSVFSDQSVRNNIRGYVGRSALETIDERLEWFADGGNRQAKHIAALDKLRAAHTYGSLGFKWSIAMKQLTSLPAYAFDMSFKDFGKYFGLFVKDFKKNIGEMLDTPYVQTRFKSGYERDVIDGLRREGGSRFMKALQVGMLSGKAGDIVPVIIGGWMARQRSYDNAKKAGLSDADARKKSDIDFEMITDRAQQAGDMKDLSSFQGGGSMFKLFTMYKTSPRQYYANVAESFADAGKLKGLLSKGGKPGSKKEFARRFFIAQVMLPMTFQFVSDITKAPFKMLLGDDEEEYISGENYLRAMLLGPLNGIFIAGDALDMLISGISDTTIWAKKITILDGVQEVAQGFGKLNATGLISSFMSGEDWDGDITGAADKIARGMGRITPGAMTFYDIIRDEIKRLEGLTGAFD